MALVGPAVDEGQRRASAPERGARQARGAHARSRNIAIHDCRRDGELWEVRGASLSPYAKAVEELRILFFKLNGIKRLREHDAIVSEKGPGH